MLPFLRGHRPPSRAVCDTEIHETMAAKSGHICFGKGGSQQATPTTTTVNQNKLPDFAQPYLQQALSQGQALSQNAYTPYPGQQLAPLADQQVQSMQLAGQLGDATNPVFQQAQSTIGGAANAGMNAGGFNANQIGSNYQPGQIGSNYQPGGIASNFNAQRWTDPGVSQAYMDPYQQQVTDQTINQIRQQSGIQQGQIASGAAAAGAFGGDRAAVMGGMNNYYTQQSIAQAQAAGGQSAWASGQNQFNADQQARYNQGALNLQGQQANEQSRYQAGQLGLQGQQANEQARYQAGQLGLQGQQYNEQARLGAAQLGLQGGQLANAAGQNLGYLGTSMQNANLQDVTALQNAGGIAQAQQQSANNVGYQNFLNQLNFPYQQVGFQAGLINGLPLGNVGTSAAYQNPNTVSQMLGLGLGGLGLSQALGKV